MRNPKERLSRSVSEVRRSRKGKVFAEANSKSAEDGEQQARESGARGEAARQEWRLRARGGSSCAQ